MCCPGVQVLEDPSSTPPQNSTTVHVSAVARCHRTSIIEHRFAPPLLNVQSSTIPAPALGKPSERRALNLTWALDLGFPESDINLLPLWRDVLHPSNDSFTHFPMILICSYNDAAPQVRAGEDRPLKGLPRKSHQIPGRGGAAARSILICTLEDGANP